MTFDPHPPVTCRVDEEDFRDDGRHGHAMQPLRLHE